MTTRAKSTSVPGVCHGFFYYLNDDSEIDIEILTSYVTKGLENGIPPGQYRLAFKRGIGVAHAQTILGLEFTNHGEVSCTIWVRMKHADTHSCDA